MNDSRKKNLRLAIKEMAIASSRKLLREYVILSPVHVLYILPVYIITRSKILALLNFHECETAKPI